MTVRQLRFSLLLGGLSALIILSLAVLGWLPVGVFFAVLIGAGLISAIVTYRHWHQIDAERLVHDPADAG